MYVIKIVNRYNGEFYHFESINLKGRVSFTTTAARTKKFKSKEDALLAMISVKRGLSDSTLLQIRNMKPEVEEIKCSG